jgi:hypothetical protein
MTIQFPKILLPLALCGAFLKSAPAQQIENVVGAPFTAIFSRTTPGQPKRTCQVARASDGSMYYGCSGADGRLSSVDISDVPNNRRITFFVPPPNVPNHIYAVSTPPHGKYTIVSADEVREAIAPGPRFLSRATPNFAGGKIQ